MVHTIRFTRRNLPHWEVEGGRYFITVRCADSLPHEAVLRMAELKRTFERIQPGSPELSALQRRIFRTAETFLDASAGACPLRTAAAAEIVVTEFAALAEVGVTIPHFTVMPNHWHALLVSHRPTSPSLTEIMKRVKGRTAKRLRQHLGGTGPVWQREWFDHWIRHEAEWERCADYIRQNPVKAGLVSHWSEHPWTR
jgi:REP element-mobilizing transposase RayT